jgi:hypothetical protein
MDINRRKVLILEGIRLGMDFYKSCLLAECPDAMIEELEKDALFMSRIKIEEALKEKELLERHEQAMLLAALKGNTNALQWKLERLDPDRWASGRRGDDEGKEKVKIYVPKNGRGVNDE